MPTIILWSATVSTGCSAAAATIPSTDDTGASSEMNGEAGNDTIYGGPGNDYITGGDGDDVVVGGTERSAFAVRRGRQRLHRRGRREQ